MLDHLVEDGNLMEEHTPDLRTHLTQLSPELDSVAGVCTQLKKLLYAVARGGDGHYILGRTCLQGEPSH